MIIIKNFQNYDTMDRFVLPYQSVFNLWLPNSEYDVDSKPCLEFLINNPVKDKERKYNLTTERKSILGGPYM
jgi:DNA gyrase inhibitor GyrI